MKCRSVGWISFALLLFVFPVCKTCPSDYNTVTQLGGILGAILDAWILEEDFQGCEATPIPGVICDTNTGCIVGLQLNAPGLYGTIPALIGQLTNLVSLNITNTQYHTIPDLQQLGNIIQMDLSNNALAKGLDQFLSGQFPNLQSLNLANNNFTGSLPPFGANSTRRGLFPFFPVLHTLNVAANNFASGLEQVFSGALPSIQALNLAANSFAGYLPVITADVANTLTQLDVSANALTGGLEQFLSGHFPNLQSLNLAGNNFAGALPAFGNELSLPVLTFFSMADNALTDIANAATAFVSATALAVVDFSNNLITAVDQFVVGALNALNNFLTLILSGNLISGTLLDLTQFLATLPQNIVLDLSDNYLCGLIPPLASRIVTPNRLILNNNCFFKPIPNWCGTYTNTCSYMKLPTTCDPVIANSSCPPVVAGNQALASGKLSVSLQNGPAVNVVPVSNGQQTTTGVILIPTTIMEVDSNGLPIGDGNTTQSIPAEILERYYVDNLTVSTTGGFRVSTILNNGAFFFWECYLSNISFTKNFVEIPRLIPPNIVAELLEISYWPPTDPRTTGFALDFQIIFNNSDITLFDDTSIVGEPFSMNFSGTQSFASTFKLASANSLTAEVTLINVAYGNNNQSHNITHVLQHLPADASVAYLRAMIPFTFYPSLYYDPDLGAVFGNSGGGGGGGGLDNSDASTTGGDGSSGGSDNLYIWLPVGLGGGALLVTVSILLLIVIILFATGLYKRLWLWRRVNVVNWDPTDTDVPYKRMEGEEL